MEKKDVNRKKAMERYWKIKLNNKFLYELYREKNTISVRKWRKNNPEKNIAHRAVFCALRRGDIKRGVCFCGETKVQAHHEDYTKPLEIVWYCKQHHVEADMKRRKI